MASERRPRRRLLRWVLLVSLAAPVLAVLGPRLARPRPALLPAGVCRGVFVFHPCFDGQMGRDSDLAVLDLSKLSLTNLRAKVRLVDPAGHWAIVEQDYVKGRPVYALAQEDGTKPIDLPRDIGTRRLTPDAVGLLGPVGPQPTVDGAIRTLFAPLISPQGTARVAPNRKDIIIGPDAQEGKRLRGTGVRIDAIQWSPDGRFVLYHYRVGRFATGLMMTHGLGIVDATTGQHYRLTPRVYSGRNVTGALRTWGQWVAKLPPTPEPAEAARG